jgi:Domain of unknown function (DUF5979)
VSGIPTGLSCTVTEDQANSGGFVTTVDPAGAIAVGGTVTFTNTKNGQLTIRKTRVGGLATQSFLINYDCGSISGSVSLTGGAEQTISNIPANASCTVSEPAVAGYSTTYDPSPATVTVPAGGVAVVTVTNTRTTGSLTINKRQVGGTDQVWSFDVTCSGGGETFKPPVHPSVTGSNSVTVLDIPTGLSCTVTEDQANSGGFITTVAPAGAVLVGGSITFTNTKQVRLTIIKTQNGGAPTFIYTFRLSGGPDNVSISRSTAAGSLTPLDFGLVKPGTYTLCELAVAAGTTSSLPGGVVDPVTGNVCASITLQAGVDQQLTINNQLRSGGQRTIGYWKNWSTCSGSNGNQLANAAATGKTLLDQVLPITLGSYVVDTCAKGVAVLSSAAGRYAENQLAAQLLAAKANVVVGAACGNIGSVITQADALLVAIAYKGSPSAIVGNNHPLRATILAVATTLDRFNNGLYC